MAFATINYYSHALGHAATMNVLFPDSPDAPEPWATYYLLHGLYDDYSTWARRSSIERRILGLPLVVVMPDGARGWYTNAVDGDAYEDHLLNDTMRLIERNFPVKAERAGRAIGGLSMGGFGAVKIGLKHPELFASVNSQSGTLEFLRNPIELKKPSPEWREFHRIFGDDPKDGPEDPWALAEKARPKKKKLPAFYLDCGDEDPFIFQNRAFHEHLKGLGIEHEFAERSGSHDWQYWDGHLGDALEFHARHLGLPKPNR